MRVDGDQRLAGDGALAYAAPGIDRVMAGREHRDIVRAGIGATILARAGQRAARVRLAAVQVRANRASEKLAAAQRTKAPRRTRSTETPKVPRDLALERLGNGRRGARLPRRGAKSGALAAEAGAAQLERAEASATAKRASPSVRAKLGHNGLSIVMCAKPRETGGPALQSIRRRAPKQAFRSAPGTCKDLRMRRSQARGRASGGDP